MAFYTVIDEASDVTPCKTVDASFRCVDGDDYRIEVLRDERWQKVPLTKTAFTQALRDHGEVRIWDQEKFGGDWIYKVQKHTKLAQ